MNTHPFSPKTGWKIGIIILALLSAFLIINSLPILMKIAPGNIPSDLTAIGSIAELMLALLALVLFALKKRIGLYLAAIVSIVWLAEIIGLIGYAFISVSQDKFFSMITSNQVIMILTAEILSAIILLFFVFQSKDIFQKNKEAGVPE